ncbi:MAG: DNA polymerase III subunit beta [Chloroflexi bacterium]|nr:DNA polymerase III subunit beta [Chloroflexota bacterium]
MTATLDILATPKAPEAGMRVSVVQDQLAKSLGVVSRAFGNRSTMPILGYVLASTDGERLRLTATNLETSITAWVPARVLSDGVACLQGSVIRETVGALPGGRDVSIEAKGFALRVECERVGANLKGADPAEFPPVNLFDGDRAVRIPAGDFRRAIEQVAFAAARDESRPVLSGVNLRIGGGALRLSAADGFRLSIRTDALVGDTDDVDVIVPARAMIEVARACGVDADDVEIMIAPNRTQIGFSVPTASGRVLITTRLLEGVFPDLDRVVPKESTTTVTLDRESLVRAIKVAQIFARDAADNVRFEITAGSDDILQPGNLEVSAASNDHGDNVTNLPCTALGVDCVISFNGTFVAEWLSSSRSEKVTLAVNGSQAPGVFRSVGDDAVVHVIMPMHNAR